jgi:hypothetical protein
VIGRVIVDRGVGIDVRSIAFPSSFRPMRRGIRPGLAGFEVGVTLVVVGRSVWDQIVRLGRLRGSSA